MNKLQLPTIILSALLVLSGMSIGGRIAQDKALKTPPQASPTDETREELVLDGFIPTGKTLELHNNKLDEYEDGTGMFCYVTSWDLVLFCVN